MSNSFLRTFSCTHRNCVDTCLSFPSPCRWMIPSAAEASVLTVACRLTPRSRASAIIPNVWAAPFTNEYSSASAELRAIVACVVDHDLSRCWPRLSAPPEVLLRDPLHPAQSESTYASSPVVLDCHAYVYIARGAPMRYLASLLSSPMSPSFGDDMRRAISFTANWTSKRSCAR